MPEGTSVGTIYFDLALKDTINAQLQAAAARTKAQVQHAFNGVGDQIQKSISATGTQAAQAAGAAWSKSVALAQLSLNKAVRAFEESKNQLNAAMAQVKLGEEAPKSVDALARRVDQRYATIEDARQRLAIQVQAAAQRQAAAEQRAYDKAAKAAEQAAVRQQAAARQDNTTKAPPAKKFSLLSSFANLAKSGAGLLRPLSGKLSALLSASLGRVSAIGSRALGGLVSRLTQVDRRFASASTGCRSFTARLRGIVSGALIFNGISAGLRQVVSYLGSAALTSGQLKTALGNLQGAAATAAAPLVQVLTPALAALANAAAAVFACLAKIIALFTGKSVSAARTAAKSMAGVGSAASGTSKKVQDAAKSLAGFDEIERLDKPDSSSGSGGITPNYSYDGTSPVLDSILEAVKAGNWNQVGQLVAQKLNTAMAAIPWPSVQNKAQTWAATIASTLNGFIARLDWRLVGSTIAQGLNTALLFVDTFVQHFHWNTLGNGIGNALNQCFAELDWESLGRVLTDKLKALLETLHGFVQTFDFGALGSDLAKAAMAGINNVDWVQAAGDLSTAAKGILDGLTNLLRGIDWAQVGQTALEYLQNIDWASIVESLFTLIGTFIGSMVELLAPTFASVGNWISSHFTDIGQNGIQGFLNGMISLLADIGSWIQQHMIDPLVNAVKNMLGIHSPSTVFADIGRNLVLGLLNGVSGIWGQITDFFSRRLDDVRQKFADTWQAVNSGASAAWNGIAATIRSAVNTAIGFMNRLLSGAAAMVNGMIDVLNRFKIDVPEDVPLIGGTSFGFALDHVSAPQIPMLARGGVIRQPTLAMMGEYSGAASNPEIAAPQSVLHNLLASAMADNTDTLLSGFEELLAVLREILEAIYGIELTDDDVGRAVQRWQRKQAMATGGFY
jgi:hypothetical protein